MTFSLRKNSIADSRAIWYNIFVQTDQKIIDKST